MEQAATNLLIVLIGAIWMWYIVNDDGPLDPPSRGRPA